MEAASYAAITLLTNIVRHDLFKDDPEAALKGAIKLTDDNVCSKVSPSIVHHHHVSPSLQNLPRSGTTAVACIQRGDKVYTGWVGDSQAMIVRNGVPTQLVKPHKPDQEVSNVCSKLSAMCVCACLLAWSKQSLFNAL